MAYRVLVRLHRWAGLAMAAFLVVVGLTGSLLAFRSRLDSVFNPQLHVTPAPGAMPLDLATLAERVEAIDPRVRAAYFPIERDQVLIAVAPRIDPATGRYYRSDQIGYDHLVLDPYTGKALGRLRSDRVVGGGVDVMSLVYDLHTSLALGATGQWMLGIVALIWTIDAFVAFWLTLPRGTGGFWRRWKHAWLVKWRASAFRVNFDLHRAGGLWMWLLVFVFAWSSVMLTLRQVYDPVTAFVFGMERDDSIMATYTLPKPNNDPRLTWRAALAAGQREVARQAAERHFTVTRPYGMAYIPQFGVYSYGVRCSDDIRGHGWDTGVWIDGDTGALRKVFLPSGQHAGNTVSTWLWALHYGDIRDSRLYRILVCLFGVVLVMLSVTGVYIWWKKRCTRHLARRHGKPRGPSGRPGDAALPLLS